MYSFGHIILRVFLECKLNLACLFDAQHCCYCVGEMKSTKVFPKLHMPKGKNFTRLCTIVCYLTVCIIICHFLRVRKIYISRCVIPRGIVRYVSEQLTKEIVISTHLFSHVPTVLQFWL